MPILPQDFDYRFFNAAPQELVLPKHLEGGEAVRLVNLTKHGLHNFVIPKMHVVFKGYAKKRQFALPGHLDTLQVKTIEQQIVMVWRTKYAVLVNEPADGVIVEIEYFN